MNQNRVSRPHRPWLAMLVSTVVLLLVASLAPVIDAVPHESSPEALSTTRWPTVTKLAELLW